MAVSSTSASANPHHHRPTLQHLDASTLNGDSVASINDSWPVHPIPFLRGPFAESIAEAMDPDLRIRRTLDAATRRLQLLELDDFSEAYSSRWRQKPDAKFHPLWKLIAQISFGVHLLQQRIAKSDEEVIKILQTHVDEVDGFLEDTNADFDLAIRDIDERTKLLLLPLDHGRTFGKMLRHRDFRTSILDGNDIIERIIARTTVAMNSSVEDVKKGIEATAELAKFLDRLGNEMRDQDRDLEGVYTAMRGNAEGWYCCFRGVQEKGERLAGLMVRLEALVSEVNRRAGIASRKVLRESRLATGSTVKYETIPTPTTPSRRHTRKLSLDKPLPPDPLRAPIMMTPERPLIKAITPRESPERSPESPDRNVQSEAIILAPPQKPHDALPPLEALTEEAEADSEQDTTDSEDRFGSKEFDNLLPSYPLGFKIDTSGTSTPQESDAMLASGPPQDEDGAYSAPLTRKTSNDGLMPLESMPVELDELDIMQAHEEDSLLRKEDDVPEKEPEVGDSHTVADPSYMTAEHFISSACQDAFEDRSLSNLPPSNRSSRSKSPVDVISELPATFPEFSPPPLTSSGTTNSISSVSAKSVDFAQIACHIELPASEPDSETGEEAIQKKSFTPSIEPKVSLRPSTSQPIISSSREPSRRRSTSDVHMNASSHQPDSMSLATAVLALRSNSFAASQRDSKDSIISSYARDHRSKKASPLSRSSSKFTSSSLARTMSIKAIGPTTDDSLVQTTQFAPTRRPPPIPSVPPISVTPESYLAASHDIVTPPRSAAPSRLSRSPVNYRLMPDVRPIPSPEPDYSPRTALPIASYPSGAPQLSPKKSQGFRKSGMNSIRGLLFKRSAQRQSSAGSLGGHVPMDY